MPNLSEIGERLLTQDNRYTQDPMFCVQIKVRDVGYAAAYGEEYCWVDTANDAVIYHDDPDFKEEPEGDEWEKFGYVDMWETVMVALTEKGCDEYMEQDGHNVRRRAFRDEVRIYVESFHRCREMIDLRAALKAGVVTSLTDAIRAFVTADAAWTAALRDHAMGRPSDISATGAALHAAKTALYRIANLPEDLEADAARFETSGKALYQNTGADVSSMIGSMVHAFSDEERREKVRAIARRVSGLESQLDAAWTNRNHFCQHINIIGREIVGPRIDAFKGDCCAPDAVSRETRKLIEGMEKRIEELVAALRKTPHDSDCHPSEGIHTDRCMEVKALLAQFSK